MQRLRVVGYSEAPRRLRLTGCPSFSACEANRRRVQRGCFRAARSRGGRGCQDVGQLPSGAEQDVRRDRAVRRADRTDHQDKLRERVAADGTPLTQEATRQLLQTLISVPGGLSKDLANERRESRVTPAVTGRILGALRLPYARGLEERTRRGRRELRIVPLGQMIVPARSAIGILLHERA